MNWRHMLGWLRYLIAVVLVVGCGGGTFRSSAPAADVDAGDVQDAALVRVLEDGAAVPDAALVRVLEDGAGDATDAPVDAAGDGAAPSSCDDPGPSPEQCGCLAAPACVHGCTWEVGPVYCANGRPECALVARDGCP